MGRYPWNCSRPRFTQTVRSGKARGRRGLGHALIRRLIEDRTPLDAMLDLANYIGAEGEPIGRDYMRFTGGGYHAYASDYYDAYYGSIYTPCGFYGFSTVVRTAAVSRDYRVPGKIVG